MITAEFDSDRQLLVISHVGHVDFEQVRSGQNKIERFLPKMRPGFRLLGDMTRLETMDPACAQALGQIMDALNDAGIGLVIRVIPDPHKDIGLNILSLFHYSRKVRITTVQTLEEANRILSERDRRTQTPPLAPRSAK